MQINLIQGMQFISTNKQSNSTAKNLNYTQMPNSLYGYKKSISFLGFNLPDPRMDKLRGFVSKLDPQVDPFAFNLITSIGQNNFEKALEILTEIEQLTNKFTSSRIKKEIICYKHENLPGYFIRKTINTDGTSEQKIAFMNKLSNWIAELDVKDQEEFISNFGTPSAIDSWVNAMNEQNMEAAASKIFNVPKKVNS